MSKMKNQRFVDSRVIFSKKDLFSNISIKPKIKFHDLLHLFPQVFSIFLNLLQTHDLLYLFFSDSPNPKSPSLTPFIVVISQSQATFSIFLPKSPASNYYSRPHDLLHLSSQKRMKTKKNKGNSLSFPVELVMCFLFPY